MTAARDPSRRVPVLVGPTASGKTSVSLLIAAQLGAEIISADSRQVFRCMDIGTAKPSLADRARVHHHFVDTLNPGEEFNAGEYGVRGRELIGKLFLRGKVPLVVGGSGLYVRALVDGFFEGVVPADPELRSGLSDRLRDEGAQTLLEELRKIDPAAASRMLPSNTRRIIRALEVYKLTGTPISELQKSRAAIPFVPVFAGLQWNRKELYARINRRVDSMIANGLVEEVKALIAAGSPFGANALKTTGYQEVFAYLAGELTLDEMVPLIKRNSRRYAKRQLTWFRRDERIRWFEVAREEDLPLVAGRIASFFSEGA
ncbi:MAG TPA: tRNA (adenosine(37)-N6)-dimethylallyltransferase MiaA [Bacteroidota bacterium]